MTRCDPDTPAGSLALGASITCTTTFTPTSADPTTITLTTTASSATADPDRSNNTAPTFVTLQAAPANAAAVPVDSRWMLALLSVLLAMPLIRRQMTKTKKN